MGNHKRAKLTNTEKRGRLLAHSCVISCTVSQDQLRVPKEVAARPSLILTSAHTKATLFFFMTHSKEGCTYAPFALKAIFRSSTARTFAEISRFLVDVFPQRSLLCDK